MNRNMRKVDARIELEVVSPEKIYALHRHNHDAFTRQVLCPVKLNHKRRILHFVILISPPPKMNKKTMTGEKKKKKKPEEIC